MSLDSEILDRLSALDARLQRIETRLDQLAEVEHLRADLQAAKEQIHRLAQNGLHVVERLDAARRELRQRNQGGGA